MDAMTPPSDIDREGSRRVSGAAGPEKGFFMFGSRRDVAGRHDASVQDGAGPDDRAVPDGGIADPDARTDPRAADDAVLRNEVSDRVLGEKPAPVVEGPASRGKRSPAVERFERRAE